MMNVNGAYLDLVAWPMYAPPTWVTLVAGVFVLTRLTLSLFLLFEHLPAYKIPEEQKFLIGAILMVPCYAVESMGIASAVHLFVFLARPYELMGDRFPGSVSVLGDYASVDCPVDPDEVRDSKRPTKLRLPQPDIDVKSGMTLTESVRDVLVGGGEYTSLAALSLHSV